MNPIRKLFVTVLLLAPLAASCVPAPAPVPPSPPPVTSPPAPAPTPVPPRPARITLQGEPSVRLGLAWDLEYVAITPASQPARLRLGSLEELVRPDGFTLQLAGGGIRVGMRSGGDSVDVFQLGAHDTLLMTVANPREPSFRWNGKTWRGELLVFLNPRGRITLVARIPLESYLLGVIPGEIGALASDLLEAGRAQAVAARSYTLYYMGRRASEGFDLYGTVEDQVYGPFESERPLATRCVTSTRGQTLLSAGWPIRANYSSTCGGISSEVWEAWPFEPLPYLVSHRDRDTPDDFCGSSPHYRWREEWKPADLAANLARHAPQFGVTLPPGGVGEIVDVSVASRSRSGRVWRLAVTTSTGRFEIPAYVLRQMLRRGGNPAAILRSNLFKIDVRRDPATRRAIAIVASGAGNGHGAGLCQTGALGMARRKRDAAAILRHYYPTTELARLY